MGGVYDEESQDSAVVCFRNKRVCLDRKDYDRYNGYLFPENLDRADSTAFAYGEGIPIGSRTEALLAEVMKGSTQ